MKSLNVEIHPDKTWLGRVKNGFDFLGFRITTTSIQASTKSVSRRDSKVARLYEQGANKKHIGLYLRRWLGWSTVAVLSTNLAWGAPLSPSCAVLFQGGTNNTVVMAGGIILGIPVPVVVVSNPLMGFDTICFSHTPPNTSLASSVCSGPNPITLSDNVPFYVHITDTGNTVRCSYFINSDSTDVADSWSLYTTPTAVPIFTPIGIIATISGLLWFGRRRSIKLKNS